MTEPVRPLEALIAEKIAEWRKSAKKLKDRNDDPGYRAGFEECAHDLESALLQAAAPPVPTAEPAAWRPIQTAPKDRRIVVWLETQRKGIVNWREKAQRWHEDGMGFCDPIYWFDVPTPDFDDAGETHGTVLS
jgi:hypothetical protein